MLATRGARRDERSATAATAMAVADVNCSFSGSRRILSQSTRGCPACQSARKKQAAAAAVDGKRRWGSTSVWLTHSVCEACDLESRAATRCHDLVLGQGAQS